ncbi:uncharacterized protein LOC136083510 isoform X2 [Hydra vulgaris]|uniref:Uncharacterized protein LOC136083510 isoform X2 n=1 Tax=Hydra vulgaris TaxID=6087 RepID=A0ABM4CBD5_HYDVU
MYASLALLTLLQFENSELFYVERYSSKNDGDFLYLNEKQCNFVTNSTWVAKFNVCVCFAGSTFHILKNKMGCYTSSNEFESECSNSDVSLVSWYANDLFVCIIMPILQQNLFNVYLYTNNSWQLVNSYPKKNQVELLISDHNNIRGKLIKLAYNENKQKCVVLKVIGKAYYPFIHPFIKSVAVNRDNKSMENAFLSFKTKKVHFSSTKRIASVTLFSCFLVIIAGVGIFVYIKKRNEEFQSDKKNRNEKKNENEGIYTNLVLTEVCQGEYSTLTLSVQNIQSNFVCQHSSSLKVDEKSTDVIQEHLYFEIEPEVNITT